MSDVDPKVLDRIAKLLALAGNNPNPNEAALALQRAQELMKQHGVSTSDAEVGPIKEHPLRSWASASRTKDYELALFGGIARAFGCELMFQAGHGKSWLPKETYYAHYVFVGQAVDVKVATYAATNLSKAMRKARNAYLASLKRDYSSEHYPRTAPRRWLARKGDSYCLGWAMAVVEKVEPLVRPSVAKRVAEYVAKQTEGRKAKGKEREVDFRAMADGDRDGKEVQVHRPLDAGSKP